MPLPSERKFGALFVVVFSALAVHGSLRDWERWPVLAGIALAFAVVTLLVPRALRPLNRAWLAFGLLLGKVVNPIVLGVIFFFVVTPVALFLRLIGRDELRLRTPRGTGSLWIEREPPGPAPDSFHRQY